MEEKEGSKLVVIPARVYYSCRECKYHEFKMVRTGQHPIIAHNCTHHLIMGDIRYYSPMTGNLIQDITPDWCPIEIVGTDNPNEIIDLNTNEYAHFVDDNNVIHGDLNDEEIKHKFVDGKLKWYVDYNDERVWLHPVYYIPNNNILNKNQWEKKD